MGYNESIQYGAAGTLVFAVQLAVVGDTLAPVGLLGTGVLFLYHEYTDDEAKSLLHAFIGGIFTALLFSWGILRYAVEKVRQR